MRWLISEAAHVIVMWWLILTDLVEKWRLSGEAQMFSLSKLCLLKHRSSRVQYLYHAEKFMFHKYLLINMVIVGLLQRKSFPESAFYYWRKITKINKFFATYSALQNVGWMCKNNSCRIRLLYVMQIFNHTFSAL